MNSVCSSCLELFTSRSDISTTPCGHVFHTECIKKWLENGQNNCSQCWKSCGPYQINKLYFSEADSENALVSELMEENLKLQSEATESKFKMLQESQKCLQIQEEKLKLAGENLKLQTDHDKSKSQLMEANLKLLQIQDEN